MEGVIINTISHTCENDHSNSPQAQLQLEAWSNPHRILQTPFQPLPAWGTYPKSHYHNTILTNVKTPYITFQIVCDAITCSSINAAVSTIRLRPCLSSDRAVWSFCSSSSLNARSPCWERILSNQLILKHHGWYHSNLTLTAYSGRRSLRDIEWLHVANIFFSTKFTFFIFENFILINVIILSSKLPHEVTELRRPLVKNSVFSVTSVLMVKSQHYVKDISEKAFCTFRWSFCKIREMSRENLFASIALIKVTASLMLFGKKNVAGN